MDAPMEIAIIGSGVAAVCIAKALQEDPKFRLRIYESNERFNDDGGQNINIQPDGQRAMELLHPNIRKAFDDAGATPYDGWEFHIGSGPAADQRIVRWPFPRTPNSMKGVKRSLFVAGVRELLKEGTVKMGSKLVDIQETNETPKYRLVFANGSVAQADAIIGCDGYNSYTRQWIYGFDDPDAKGHITNTVALRHLMTRKEAIDVFGEEYCDGVYGRGYACEGMFMLTDWSQDGQYMQLVTEWWNYPGGWPFGDDVMWHEWDKERLKKDMAHLGGFGVKALGVWLSLPKIYASTRRTHAPARIAHKGAVCVAGDAMQTFQPYNGVGSATALLDALGVVVLLKSVKTPTEIPNAFEIYDDWRRPLRTARAKESNEAAIRWNGLSDLGVDIGRWLESFNPVRE
jgi:salicylate hydroxylase